MLHACKVNQGHQENRTLWGAWVSQSVKPLTLGFSSGHDLPVRGLRPNVGLCTDSAEPAWDSLPLSAPALCACTLTK